MPTHNSLKRPTQEYLRKTGGEHDYVTIGMRSGGGPKTCEAVTVAGAVSARSRDMGNDANMPEEKQMHAPVEAKRRQRGQGYHPVGKGTFVASRAPIKNEQ